MSPPLSPVTISRPLSLRKTFDFFHSRNDLSVSTRSSGKSGDSDASSKKHIRKEEKRRSKDCKRHSNEAFREELVLRRRKSSLLAAETEGPVMRARYGVLSPNIYTKWQGNDWWELSQLSALNEGKTVIFRARIHAVRKMSSKMLFLVFRQQLTTVQAVLSEEAEVVSAHMVHRARQLALEDIVTVRGTIRRPFSPITGASVTDTEVRVRIPCMTVRDFC
jgi:ergosteryl-3beta-O-L-aspartate synthase